MMKKIISALICIAMTLNLITVSVSAEGMSAQTVSANEGIIEALRLIEPVKENYGLTEADLENMEVAGPIKTYEYTSEGISFLRNYFPLVCGNELAAWAIEDIDGDEVFYQISTAYIDEVNEIVDSAMAFALIYDANNCYLYDGVGLHKLGCFEEYGGRSVLTEDVLETSDIDLSHMGEANNLGYTQSAIVYGAVPQQTIYKCNARYVPQNVNGYKKICWAATVACIINSVKGTNYTALSFLADNPESTPSNRDEGLPLGKEEEILNKYGLNYSCIPSSVPPISNIIYNIRNNAPMFASFKNEFDIFHSCTLYGCMIDNQNNGAPICIYIIDPLYGEDVANYSANDYTYKYVNGSTGKHYALNYTTRRY